MIIELLTFRADVKIPSEIFRVNSREFFDFIGDKLKAPNSEFQREMAEINNEIIVIKVKKIKIKSK